MLPATVAPQNKEVLTARPVNTQILKINLHLQLRKAISGWQSCEEEANRKLAVNTALILFFDNRVLGKLMFAEVCSKRRIWQRIPPISKARFPVQKCTTRACIPVCGTHEMGLGLNLHILSAVWSHSAPDTSSYRHTTAAKGTGSLASSSKLRSDHIRSYPAIIATHTT